MSLPSTPSGKHSPGPLVTRRPAGRICRCQVETRRVAVAAGRFSALPRQRSDGSSREAPREATRSGHCCARSAGDSRSGSDDDRDHSNPRARRASRLPQPRIPAPVLCPCRSRTPSIPPTIPHLKLLHEVGRTIKSTAEPGPHEHLDGPGHHRRRETPPGPFWPARRLSAQPGRDARRPTRPVHPHQ